MWERNGQANSVQNEGGCSAGRGHDSYPSAAYAILFRFLEGRGLPFRENSFKFGVFASRVRMRRVGGVEAELPNFETVVLRVRSRVGGVETESAYLKPMPCSVSNLNVRSRVRGVETEPVFLKAASSLHGDALLRSGVGR